MVIAFVGQIDAIGIALHKIECHGSNPALEGVEKQIRGQASAANREGSSNHQCFCGRVFCCEVILQDTNISAIDY